MDAELRVAEHSRDIATWRKLKSRETTRELADELTRLQAEQAWLLEKVDALKDILPLCACACGSVALVDDAWCQKHANAPMELARAGTRWLEKQDRESSVFYMEAFVICGMPGKGYGDCHFPPCQKKTGMDYDSHFTYCNEHNEVLRHVSLWWGKAKKRG